MVISNLRIESKDGKSYLGVDVQCSFCQHRHLWFAVDDRYSDYLTSDSFDPFLIAAVYMAMYYQEDIRIEGNVTERLYRNLTKYIIPTINALYPSFRIPTITISQFRDATSSHRSLIGTGYSGGVDSFSTIIDTYEKEESPYYRLNTLFFFNVGQYRGKDQKARYSKAMEFYLNGKVFADEVGLPYIFLDSNLFDFYLPDWEYDAGPLCRIAAILVFQKSLIRYYVSGSNHYLQQNSSLNKHLDDVTDEFIYSMLSSDKFEIILDGNQYYRSDKVLNLLGYSPAHRHLNVCINSNIDVQKEKNCSRCHKCLRTLIELEAFGKLDDFSSVFDIEYYKKHSWEYKCKMVADLKHDAFYIENFRLAKKYGLPMPSRFQANLYVVPRRMIKYTSSFITRAFNKILRMAGIKSI